jgi:uncharacterized delta-60 repeat protein
MPTPMTPVGTPGSLVYETMANGALASASDSVSFSVSLDAGQALTILVTTGDPFTPALSVFGPANDLLASAKASAPSSPCAIQSLPVGSAGMYTFTVSSADSGFGAFSLTVDLNAARDSETAGGTNNDSIATAQDLNAAFIRPGAPSDMSRAAVLGSFDTLFFADFESGLSGFTVDNSVANGLWHLSTGRATQSGHTATRSFYFGKGEGTNGGGTYATGARTAGYLISPAISLPTNESALSLSFNYVLKTEGSVQWDKAILQITQDGGANWTNLANYNGVAESTVWKAAAPINLLPYAGKTISLRWSFDTIDGQANTYEGWYVDDVRLQGGTPHADYYAFDLAAGEHVTLLATTPAAANMTMALLDAGGSALTTASSGVSGLSALIDQYSVAAAGTYYLKMTGNGGARYTLLVNRNAAIDLEPNDTAATAQDITPSGAVVGSLYSGALAPFISEDFESAPPLSGAWTTYSSSADGRVSVETSGPTGKFLFLQTVRDATNLNEAIYTVNLAGQSKATLSFSHLNSSDSVDAFKGDFTGHANADGIAVSADGINWHPIWTPPAQGNTWVTYTLDLAALAAQGGIALVANFRIKFQQYMSFGYAGRGWDNITISTPIAGVDYYALNLAAGVAVTLSTTTPGDGPFEFANTLNPVLSLYDAAGNVLGADDNSAADGKNAQLVLLTSAAGRYVVKVGAATRDSGDYILQAVTRQTGPAPTAPLDLSGESDSGVSDTDNVTNDNTPTFELPPGLFGFRVYRNSVRISGALETGDRFMTSPQTDGAADYSFSVVDAAGNESALSQPLHVTIDTLAPAAPGAPDLQAGSDSGASSTDNLTNINTPSFDLPGIAPGHFFRLYRNNVLISGNYESGGNYTTLPLADGAAAYAVRSIDAAGNQSAPGPALTVTIVTSVAPVVPDLISSSDLGPSNSDNITKYTTPAFTVPGAFNYRLFRDGVELTTGPTSGSSFEHTPLPDGVYSYTAIVGDAAGNFSNMSAPLMVTIDTVPPPTPVAPDLEATSDDGVSDSDGVTSVTNPTLDIPVGDGNYYMVGYRSNYITSTTPSQTFQPGFLADGQYLFGCLAIDAAGNMSSWSPNLAVTIDTTPPQLSKVIELNPKFGVTGREIFGAGTPMDFAAGSVVMPDGRIVTGGYAQAGAEVRLVAFRMMPDGTPDPSFGTGGTASMGAGNGAVMKHRGGNFAVGPDGKIVVMGSPDIGSAQNGIIRMGRFNADGSVDQSFGFGGLKVYGFPSQKFAGRSVAIQPDGKVVVGGFVVVGPNYGDWTPAVARFNADGSIDTSFGQAGLAVYGAGSQPLGYSNNVVVQSDGKILASVAGGTLVAIRFNPDGSLDPGYGSDGAAILRTFGFFGQGGFVQPDGKFVIYGIVDDPASRSPQMSLGRLNANGTQDDTFTSNIIPSFLTNEPFGAVQLADGRYLVMGQQDSDILPYYWLAFEMFKADGAVDTSFAQGGMTTMALAGAPDWPTALTSTAAGDVIATGRFEGGAADVFVAHFSLVDNFRLDLQDGSDTGWSATDNVTSAQTLTFEVHTPETYYRIYRNGVRISDVYATGPTFTVGDQPEGTWDYTVRAVDAAGNESAPGAPARVTIDRTPPAITSMTFVRDTAGQSLRLSFSEDVSGAISTASLVLWDAQGSVVPTQNLAVAYDAATNTAIFTFPGYPRGILPDGRYTAAFNGLPLADRAGNVFLPAQTWQFSQLQGDLNGDGVVDTSDFAILMAHMGRSDQSFADGDLNGDRRVGFADFQIFELAFGKALDALGGAMPGLF